MTGNVTGSLIRNSNNVGDYEVRSHCIRRGWQETSTGSSADIGSGSVIRKQRMSQ
ncbi:MAG: hypothetical protein IKY94_11975 [Lachnospiraceae bacterium]|nr:hypothetical protein [Lachnospiraceae bacterium]